MADSLEGKVAPTTRVFFRGGPADCTEDAIKQLFSKYGSVDALAVVSGNGFVEFQQPASASKAAEDSGKISVQGKTIEMKKAMVQLSGGIDAGLSPLALVEPAKSPEALDTVVVRGHTTATAIGLVAMYAKANTTVLVLWEHHSRPEQEANVSNALQKRVYNTMEEEFADGQVMSKAFEYFGSGAPKCALVHVGSDKVKQSAQMENPLWQVDEVCAGIKENHIETLTCFYACGIYQPWLHAFRACCFILVPGMLGWDWPDDLCTCTIGSRRTVKADPLRTYDGAGWTIGLQTTSDSAPVNTSLAYAAMNNIVLSDESKKHQYTGKVMNLTMPRADMWFKGAAQE